MKTLKIKHNCIPSRVIMNSCPGSKISLGSQAELETIRDEINNFVSEKFPNLISNGLHSAAFQKLIDETFLELLCNIQINGIALNESNYNAENYEPFNEDYQNEIFRLEEEYSCAQAELVALKRSIISSNTLKENWRDIFNTSEIRSTLSPATIQDENSTNVDSCYKFESKITELKDAIGQLQELANPLKNKAIALTRRFQRATAIINEESSAATTENKENSHSETVVESTDAKSRIVSDLKQFNEFLQSRSK